MKYIALLLGPTIAVLVFYGVREAYRTVAFRLEQRRVLEAMRKRHAAILARIQ